MSHKIRNVLSFLILSTPLLADVGTWTKTKITNGNEGGFIWENEELAFYDEFSFDANVMVIPSEKPYRTEVTFNKEKNWLRVNSSHATQCEVSFYNSHGNFITSYTVQTNEKYNNIFNNVSASQLNRVSRIHAECNKAPEAQYLCAGTEIRCKNDNDVLMIYLGEPFSPEAKEYKIEVHKAYCVPENKAYCSAGWEISFDGGSMKYCEKE